MARRLTATGLIAALPLLSGCVIATSGGSARSR